MNTTRIGAEVALVIGTAGLLLELVQSHSWAILLICITGLAWLQVRKTRP